MSLSSLYLDAFTEVARLKSFSQAAVKLNVTQSALSQRVLNLEQEIGSSLFIRDPSGLKITDLGQRLLRYCHSKNLLEAEFMESLKPTRVEGLSGLMRVAGFSTVNRSVLMPIFSQFIKSNPMVNIEIQTGELRDLPPLLFSGAVDLVVTVQPLEKQGVENHLIGYEQNVLVQSSTKSKREDIYLDTDEEDTTTIDFFKIQKQKVGVLKRNFIGDIYSIIDGVKLGMGRAVVPLHLINEMKGIEVLSEYKPLKTSVFLNYYTQAFYTALQSGLIQEIKSKAPKIYS